jgi:hypothetical protein
MRLKFCSRFSSAAVMQSDLFFFVFLYISVYVWFFCLLLVRFFNTYVLQSICKQHKVAVHGFLCFTSESV